MIIYNICLIGHFGGISDPPVPVRADQHKQDLNQWVDLLVLNLWRAPLQVLFSSCRPLEVPIVGTVWTRRIRLTN